jgi:hypothetical protein
MTEYVLLLFLLCTPSTLHLLLADRADDLAGVLRLLHLLVGFDDLLPVVDLPTEGGEK